MKAFLVSGFSSFFFILAAVSSISAQTVTVSNEPHHVSVKFILGPYNLYACQFVYRYVDCSHFLVH